jgi:hypothetical protein
MRPSPGCRSSGRRAREPYVRALFVRLDLLGLGPVLLQKRSAPPVVAVRSVECGDQRTGVAQDHADAAPSDWLRSVQLTYLSWLRPRSAGPCREPTRLARCSGSAGASFPPSDCPSVGASVPMAVV